MVFLLVKNSWIVNLSVRIKVHLHCKWIFSVGIWHWRLCHLTLPLAWTYIPLGKLKKKKKRSIFGYINLWQCVLMVASHNFSLLLTWAWKHLLRLFPSQQCSGGFTLKLHVLRLAAVIFTPKCFSLLIVWNTTCCRKIIEKTTHCSKNGQENNGNRTILNSTVWDYLKFLTQGFSFHSLLCGCPQIITTHVLILGSLALKKKKKKMKEKSISMMEFSSSTVWSQSYLISLHQKCLC